MQPKSLKLFQPRIQKSIKYVGEDESKSTQGTEILAEEYKKLILTTFKYDDKFYQIITDFKNTYIAEIENQKFKNLKQVADEPLWSYSSEHIIIDDNHKLISFGETSIEGYIEIFNSSIFIHRY